MRARGAAMAILFALVYLAFPTRAYYWDGISFAINIENAQDWRRSTGYSAAACARCIYCNGRIASLAEC
jgi:hypothetical protein